MSFKFIPADDLPDEELAVEECAGDFTGDELPADFAALGEQLQADAFRLGSVYPACRPPLELIEALAPRPQRPHWARWLVGSSAAAAILLAVGLIVAMNVPQQPAVTSAHSNTTAPEAVPAESIVAVVPAPTPPVVSLPVEPTRPAFLTPSRPVSYRPAVVGVSGPQLEGLLDLWNEQPQAGATIAF
ncbi:hypothetical protein ETAA8_26310 [Anatilimnocola aggregata]|uniref:Uncharacterized protein n=1 Tax=Anatilimnocola aggregata TaxID=2528021 RepID=A0A517YBA9_9BACT|nr:hypothetical protein [Anatilimnocola aggregata]QDU27543.1 hypothetical protein ETAA8_26310 [Anatilimnocola aggregata]